MTAKTELRPRPKSLSALEPELKRLPFKTAKRQLLDAFECLYLQALLCRYGTNLTRASKGADLSRRQLRELMRKHGYRPRSGPPRGRPAKASRKSSASRRSARATA